MSGFTGFNNGTLMAANVDFRQVKPVAPQMVSDGQLLIGAGVAPFIRANTLTAGTGVTITNGPGTITIALTGGSTAIESITVDTTTGAGTNPVVPTVDGSITFSGGQYATGTFGTRVVDINSPSANTLNVLIQQSSAVASSDITKNGLAHFNSSQFSVSNGFVSLTTGGFTWNDITSASQTISVQNGYVTDRGGGVTYTLPATASFGDEFIITGKSGLWTLAQNANQQVTISSSSTTVGVGGSLAATNAGDSIWAVCTTAGASTVWRIFNFVGNITVT